MIELLAPVLLAAVGFAYARRAKTLAERGQPVPWWRQLCFGLGLLILLVTDVPPLSELAEELIVAHMAQHLLIGDLAALGIALGLTGPLLQPLLRLPGLGWLRHLGNPLIALPLWILNLYLWHLGALYQGVLDSPALHFAQHFGFLTFGVIMWMPVVGPLPTPSWFGNAAKLVYVVAVRFSGDGLALRLGSVMLVRTGSALAAGGLALALCFPNPLVCVFGFGAMGAGLGTIIPQVFSAAGRIPGRDPAAALATVSTLGYFGFLVGPPLIGFIAEWLGLRTGLSLVVLACLVALSLAGLVGGQRSAAGRARAC